MHMPVHICMHMHMLAGLEQPWNCPHGRPTLRHLVDLAALEGTPATRDFDAELCAYPAR